MLCLRKLLTKLKMNLDDYQSVSFDDNGEYITVILTTYEDFEFSIDLLLEDL